MESASATTRSVGAVWARRWPGERRAPGTPAGSKAACSSSSFHSSEEASGAAGRVGRAGEQQLPLAGVAGQLGGAFELGSRLGVAAELVQEIAADARQEVVALQRRLGCELVNQLEAGRRTERHRHCDG